MQIRKCTEADIAATGEFSDSVVKWLDDHTNYPRWRYRVYPSENNARMMTEEGSQYICLCDGKIIGAFALNTIPQGTYWKGHWKQDLPEGSYMVLHAMAIAPDIHRKGVGTEIIRFCVDLAKSQGYRAVRLDVVPDNYPARALFEKNGFSYAGDADLELITEHIPVFSLYELNW